MYWTIFFYVLLGWLVMHFRGVQQFNKATPQISYLQSLKLYITGDWSAFIISVIGLVIIVNALNLGLAGWILTTFLQVPIEVQNANQLRVLGFIFGTLTQWILSFLEKPLTKKAQI